MGRRTNDGAVQKPIRIRARRSCRLLLRNKKGSAAIEFALVATPLLALLIAIIETAIVFFAQQGLQSTAESAGRKLLTGQSQKAGMSAAQFQTATCASLPPYMNCANLMIDVQASSDFSSIDTSRPTITFKNGAPSNTWSYNTGSPGSVVILRLMYIWPLPTGPLGFNLANISPNQRLLIATTVFKSEVY